MKLEYSLALKNKIVVEGYESDLVQLNIEDAEIYLEIDTDNLLKNVKVLFKGLPIKWERNDLISPYYPEKRISAYKIYSYLANRILIQTSQDSFDLEKVLHMHGNVSPETEEEIECFQKYRKRVFTDLQCSYSILGSVRFTDYEEKHHYSEAFSNFADGLKTNSLITRYEQFYKIIEAFFDGTGATLDGRVSDYVYQFDPEFTPDHLRNLRILRNRCIHPQHNQGHISSENIELLEEVNAKVSNLKKLVSLLLENPPR